MLVHCDSRVVAGGVEWLRPGGVARSIGVALAMRSVPCAYDLPEPAAGCASQPGFTRIRLSLSLSSAFRKVCYYALVYQRPSTSQQLLHSLTGRA